MYTVCEMRNRLEVVEGEEGLAGGLGDIVSEQFHDGKHGETTVLQFFGQFLDLLVTFKGTNATKLREVTGAEVSRSLSLGNEGQLHIQNIREYYYMGLA